jgi:SAM-dependent methyltransferase
LIRVLKNNPWVATKLQVRNIDTNQHALDIGRQKVDALGIGKSFQFICNDFAKVKSCDADVIILVGVLCTMPMDISIKILKTLKRYCRKGGMIIYSTNQLAMIEADPLADFFMRLAGWTMDYKTDEESIMIGELAGWKYKDQFFDDGMHFQCMTVCNK